MSAATMAAAQAAAESRAIKASGAIIQVDPPNFLNILNRQKEPLVVRSEGGFWNRGYFYLTNYKGLTFHTKSPTPLMLSPDCEIIRAGKIWIPD